MRKQVPIPVAVMLAAQLLAGCAERPPAYIGLYESLREDPAVFDRGVLAGRRIVIDPGHGGAFTGAFGPDSLTEAEVNLGVALYLWGLLRDAGADVLLTRTTDRDFLPGEGGVSADDLAARIELANAFAPEVFISIHHNASAVLDGGKNAVEVYYRGDDVGASLELATDLHTHLARNLGIGETMIKPGNYFVLRRSTAAASVLGEASYLSHPGVEQRLKLAAKQKLEAEAYFLGLIRYFARGVPTITRIAPVSDTLRAPGTLVFEIAPAAGVPVDPASIEGSVGRRRISPVFLAAADTVAFDLPPDLPNGRHEVTITARSVRRATAALGPLRIVIDRPAAFILPLRASRPAPARGYTLAVLVLDADGRPVADDTPVEVTGPGAKKRSLRTSGGSASFNPDGETQEGPWRVAAGTVSVALSFDPFADRPGTPHLVVDGGSGTPLPRAVARLTDARHAAADAGGLIRLADADPAPRWFKAPGYRYAFPAPGDGFGNLVRLEPLFGGLLHGVRIAIDPGGGATDDAGRGPGAVRGASINLLAARMAEQALAASGAAVMLARTGEEPLSIHERIHRVNSFGSDLALQVRFGAAAPDRGETCSIEHYPGSARGEALAGNIAAASAGLPPCLTIESASSALTFLQQTACPAVIFTAGSLLDPGTETLLVSSRWAALQTQAIVRGILGYLGGDAYAPVSFSVRVLTGTGEPIAGAAVTINDTLTLLSGDDGIAAFTVFGAGVHGCLVADPLGRRRLFPIEAAEGTAFECILP